MKKIGILGGSFMPIHNGHIEMANTAYHELNLDEIWILPNGIPPYKRVTEEISVLSRLALIQAMIKSYPYMKICDYEVRKSSFQYSYETLSYFHEKYPDYELYFIIGEDSIDYFDEWRKPEIIVKNCRIVVCGRSSSDFKSLDEKCKSYSMKYQASFIAVHMNLVPISSTDIRNKLHHYSMEERRDFLLHEDQLLRISKELYIPNDELVYIFKHRLFEDHEINGIERKEMTIQDIKDDLKTRLNPHRYEHTMGVMYTAASLAMRYDYPMETALYAGLLHDCAKYMSGSELLDFAKNHNISITDAEELAPHLLHAKVGAYYANHRYEIRDEQILEAIRVHTTGKPKMSLLDQILFIADYIEPGRDQAPRLYEIRAHAFMNLDETCVMILHDTLAYLENSQMHIDQTTLETYNYYKNITEERL